MWIRRQITRSLRGMSGKRRNANAKVTHNPVWYTGSYGRATGARQPSPVPHKTALVLPSVDEVVHDHEHPSYEDDADPVPRSAVAQRIYPEENQHNSQHEKRCQELILFLWLRHVSPSKLVDKHNFIAEDLMEESTSAGVSSLSRAQKVDLAVWAKGITPLRRAVTIYGDLVANAELDVLEAREREARLSGAKTTELREIVSQREETAQRLADTALDVVFESCTADALKQSSAAAKEAGLEGTSLVSAVMANQIVEPAGMTAELLDQIAETLPGQYAKLMAMWKQVNEDSGLNLPF